MNASGTGTAAVSSEEQLLALLSLPKSADGTESGFSVAAYLNLALQNTSDNDPTLQTRMAELALQLQLQTQSCHEDIGRIGAELQAILPRCHADVGRIGVGLQGLQQDAATLLEATSLKQSRGDGEDSKEEASVSTSLETLSTLHALQANLKRSHEILSAASTWDTTLSEIPPLLAPAQPSTPSKDGTNSSAATTSMASNLPQAVQKLALLEKGEKALAGMPHPEERREALQKLRVQISNLLSPQLQHALQSMSSRLGPLQQCVALYTQLNMMDALLRDYVTSRPTSLHKAWFDFTTQHPATALQAETEFAEWLPTWLESVLLLLQEERRQASSVFGAGHVPTILALVLQEAFRPILPSFTSRLNASKDLNGVCNLYKSTLQFLAMAYENIAGCWLDWMENSEGVAATLTSSTASSSDSASGGANSSNTIQGGPGMYRQVLEVFQRIVLPFRKHQTTLTQLEKNHANDEFANDFNKLVQDIVPSTPRTLELDDLTRATDGLWQVTKEHLVTTAQEVLERFEFLQGGYHALAALDIMDHTTKRRLDLLVTTLDQLCQNMDFANVFDEPHVLAALQVLKIAATCKSLVKQLQEHTRQRFVVLVERLSTVMAREKELATAGDDPRTAFLMPDSLSPVDINALLCSNVFSSENGEATLTVLQRLGSTDTATISSVLLGETNTAATKLATTCHKFVFSACVAVPKKQLQSMAAMTSWKDASAADAMDSYGTLPQSYITLVGEHMLALVQALEPFASDPESLALANQVMGDVRQVAQPPWRSFLKATGVSLSGGSSVTSALIDQLMDSKEITEYVISDDDAGMEDVDEEDEEDEGNDQDKAVVTFCNAWLDVVGLAVTGHLLERILNIPRLTAKGCEHLTADLGYLQNVLVALGVSGHPHPLLGHVSQVVSLDLPSLQQRIKYAEKGQPIQAALVAMEERLAAMKGMSSY